MPCSVTQVAQPRRVDAAGLGAWLRPPCPTAVWPLRCQWEHSAIGISLRVMRRTTHRLHRRRPVSPRHILPGPCTKAARGRVAQPSASSTSRGQGCMPAGTRAASGARDGHGPCCVKIWCTGGRATCPTGRVRIRSASSAWPNSTSARTAYEEWKFSLPRELARRQQMDAARDVLQTAFGDRHPYVWALHDPLAADGGRQPHVHVLWSSRTLDAYARTPEQFFRRYNREHPERGGAEKARVLGHFGSVKASRQLIHRCDELASGVGW